MSPIYLMGKLLGRFYFNTFGRLEVTGLDGVPPFGPMLLVANHLSFNDPPVLIAAINRRLNFIGKRELFRIPLTRWVLREFGVIPFERSGHAVDIVRLSLNLMAQDRALVLFPEGTRSPDHSLIQGLPGAAYIALKSQATILPVAITGTEKFSGSRVFFPRCRMRVNIGLPFSLPVIEGRPSRDVLKSLADMIMYRIAALLPEEYRGIYATAEAGREKDLASAVSSSGETTIR